MSIYDVYLFVFDGLSDWEAAHAVAGIQNPAHQVRPGRFRVRTVGQTMSEAVTAGGLRIQPDLALATLPQPGPQARRLLILPGGSAWDQGANRDAVDVARAFLRAGSSVAAICGATVGLARAGVLDDRPHTSNAREYLAATGYRGGELYEEAPAVTSGNLITASSTAAVEFAAHIFRHLGVYAPAVTDAWEQLFKTGEARHFTAMVQAAAAAAAEATAAEARPPEKRQTQAG